MSYKIYKQLISIILISYDDNALKICDEEIDLDSNKNND